ncbi:MAG: hypothetical protein EOP47_00810 [Sphingobacteriaceae bacterium]|nr:MAG: hypothetical protein EOP47_00810 [Sphingobacteriaceae bacterium]
MKTNKKNVLKCYLTYYIIFSAAIWAATIIGSAFKLKDSFSQISVLLNTAAAIQLIIWGGLAAQLKKIERGIQCDTTYN